MKLYQAVAQEIGAMIRGGSLTAGDALPSIRSLCEQRGVSPSTILRAYEILEADERCIQCAGPEFAVVSSGNVGR